MKHLTRYCSRTAVFLTIIAPLSTLPVQANDITTEWATVKPPPVPELKSVEVDPKTTALLILDLMKTNCGVRPRCMATVPNVKKLLDAARAHDMMVFYTLVGQTPTLENVVDQSLAPRPGEFVVRGEADKFIGSDLEMRLKDKGIKTVIVTCTSAQGELSAPATARYNAATRLSCRLTECRRRIPTTSNMLLGTSTKAALLISPIT
jgi:hypothetical protein